MKRTITFLIALLTTAYSGFAGDGYSSDLEKAINTTGSLYKQEIFTLDNIPAFRIDAVKVTNLENFTITSGLKVIHRVQIVKELKSFYNYIDSDEIPGILTALVYMKTILKSKTVPGNYSEIKYTTKSGFQVALSTILNVNNKLDWGFSVQTNIHNDYTLVKLNPEDIDKLQKLLEQAKAKL